MDKPENHPHHPEGFCTIATCEFSQRLLRWMRGLA